MKMKVSLFCVNIFLVLSIAAYGQQSIIDIHPTPFFPRCKSGEELKQIAQIKIHNPDASAELNLLITIEGYHQYVEKLGLVNSGDQLKEILIPDIDTSSLISFKLLDNKGTQLDKLEKVWHVQKKWKVYYNAVSHQDLGFITYYQNLRRANREAGIDLALELCKKTDAWADNDQFRWNVETSEPIIRWMMKQTPEKVEEFKRRVNEGRIEIAANHNTISSQMAGYEVLARSFYTPNRYVIDLLDIDPAKVAIINDVTGITRSWPLYAKEARIPYLMHGSNYPNCLNDMYDLPVFYWNSPDGDLDNKTLCRTDSYYSQNKVKTWDRDGVNSLIQRHIELEWEYDCIMAYDSHDFANPTLENAANIKAWNEKYAYPNIRCSVMSSFFDDISQQLVPGKVAETSKDAPDSWDDQDATDADLLAKARRVNYEIPTTEKFASIAMALSGGYPEKDIFQAYNRTVQYHEHTNGAIDGGNHQYYETERVMHQKLIDEAIEFNQSALSSSLDKIGKRIYTRNDAIVVYNALNWTRNEIVYLEAGEIPYASFSIIEEGTKKPLELQRLKNGKIVFYAENIPSLGYKTFQVKETDKPAANSSMATELDFLENDFYKLGIDREKNTISELYDKMLGQQMLDQTSPYALGEYIFYDDFKKEWKQTSFTGVEVFKGNLLDEIHISQEAYSAESVELIIYLHHKTKKIEFLLEVDKLSNGERLIGGWNRSVREAMFCAVPVNIPDFQHHHELAGAVTQPGNKELQFEASESAYYAIQHFADASNDNYGLTLSTIECPLIEYAYPRPAYWDSGARKPKEDIEKPANSNMFLYLMNNFFSTNIRVDQPGIKQFTFAIKSHRGNWQKGKAYKFAWESSHPIIAKYIPMNRKGDLKSERSFLTVENENVICSTLKPAESNGSGYILRFFELQGTKTDAKIKLDLNKRISKAYVVSLIEEDLREIAINADNEIEFEINGHGIKTIRVVSEPSENRNVQQLTAVSISDSEVKLSWAREKSMDVSHFKVYRSRNPEFKPGRQNFIGTTEGTTYIDKTELYIGGWPGNRLEENTSYFYRVVPVDFFNNEGPFSEAVKSITLSKRTADAKPEKVKGVYTVHVSPLAPENYINLWFYTNFEKDVDKYQIHRGLEAGFTPDASNLLEIHIPSEHSIEFNGTYNASELNRQMYADKTAEINKVYYYKVCAVDARGQKGEYSDPAVCNMNVVPVSITQLKTKNRNFATFSGVRRIRIQSTIPGGEIFYDLDHPKPSRKSKKYEGEIEVRKNEIIHVAVYKPAEDTPAVRYSQFEKVSQSLYQSSYGSQYKGDMAIDGTKNTGSQWVSKQYGGGTKENPLDVWLGVNLPGEIKIKGVVIAGDDREMMPVQNGFKVLLRKENTLFEAEDVVATADSTMKNYYVVDFGEEQIADGIMIFFDKDALPTSALPEQDGLVRIMELMVITPEGKKSFINQF